MVDFGRNFHRFASFRHLDKVRLCSTSLISMVNSRLSESIRSKDTESTFPDRKADANEYFRSIRINQRFSLMVADSFERLVNAKNQKPMHGTNQKPFTMGACPGNYSEENRKRLLRPTPGILSGNGSGRMA
ncbi:hypothetical protein T10_7268 [Trichinella papuae]|uniref:Uncharacterized protein n=1 Tax=Trichinella papuae TaxID=268474 RepID=A0A0V1MQQ8_9BILA|nr:hypothetical protein T10_7268 [Trichinella papuae]